MMKKITAVLFVDAIEPALPVWTEFMKIAHQDLPKDPFRMPPGVVMKRICAQTGELATRDCPEVVEEVFVEQSGPVWYCRVHSAGAQERRRL